MNILEDMLPKITEPLFTTKSEGMGLGLSISIALLQNNDIEAKITSKPGQGTSFQLRLAGELKSDQ